MKQGISVAKLVHWSIWVQTEIVAELESVSATGQREARNKRETGNLTRENNLEKIKIDMI